MLDGINNQAFSGQNQKLNNEDYPKMCIDVLEEFHLFDVTLFIHLFYWRISCLGKRMPHVIPSTLRPVPHYSRAEEQ